MRRLLVGCKGLWPMWEGGGTLVRNLIGVNHGTITSPGGGSPLWSPSHRGIGVRSGSHFGDSPNPETYVEIPNFQTLESTALTVLAVFRLFEGNNADVNMVLSRRDGWFLGGDGSDHIRFVIETGGQVAAASVDTLVRDRCYTAVGCYDPAIGAVYLCLDGALQSAAAQSGTMAVGTGTLKIGANSDGGLSWPGEILLAAVWPDVALSPNACLALSRDPFGLIRPFRRPALRRLPYVATLSGTATEGIDEQDIRDGGKTLILTLGGGAQFIPA